MWDKVRDFWRKHKKGTIAGVLVAAGMPVGVALQTGEAVDEHTRHDPAPAEIRRQV